MTILDSETKAGETPEDHGNELRLWLRLLTCTTLIEGEVRSRLRERFDVTLPRFDLMAQLDKAPDGMTLSDVSKRMMVSNGNVTGLVERLCESGHLDRRTSDQDAVARLDAVILDQRMRQPVRPIRQFLVGTLTAVADQRDIVAEPLLDQSVGQLDPGIEIFGIVEFGTVEDQFRPLRERRKISPRKIIDMAGWAERRTRAT